MIIALSYLLFSIHFSLITKVSLTIKKNFVKRITDTQIKTDHTDRNILLLIFLKRERAIYLQSPRLIRSNEGGDILNANKAVGSALLGMNLLIMAVALWDPYVEKGPLLFFGFSVALLATGILTRELWKS